MRAEKLRAGKIDVDVPLVERLLAAQFPRWAALPVRPVANDGWDNWTFHLGDRMKVRLPSDECYVPQVEKEFLWLPRLAPQLPVPIPLGIGMPGDDFPFPGRCMAGSMANRRCTITSEPPACSPSTLPRFFLPSSRLTPTADQRPDCRPFFRGASLSVYDDEARRSIAALAGQIDTAAALRVWDAAVGARCQFFQVLGPFV